MKAVLLVAWLFCIRQPDPRDLAMINAVETFVIESESEQKIPAQYRGLAQELACDQWQTREHGSGWLFRKSIRDPRAAIWLRRHRSPEVRLRANNVLLRLAGECVTCQGVGDDAQHVPENGSETCRFCKQSTWWGRCPGPCRDCRGTGRNWWKWAFD